MIDGRSILLVEDDTNLGFVIKDNLLDNGAKVTLCKDGAAGFESFYNGKFDICLLDVMLPKKDGFTLAKEIRKINTTVPILFLTAKSMLADKVEGFQIGADDYLTKPFAFEELLARINAILKRSNQKDSKRDKGEETFEIGQSTFDYKNLKLEANGTTSDLTVKEAELLRLLFIHKENVLERELALKLVWGTSDYFNGRSMDVFISRLRKYLKTDSSVKIENVHGLGFRLTHI